MAQFVTRVASAVSTRHRAAMIALFALSARVWIDAVTESIKKTGDLAERVERLEAGHAGDPAAHAALADEINPDREQPPMQPGEFAPPVPDPPATAG